MTNQSPGLQPALRPLTVLVRAGRLTKFKGQVASIAPGLSVVVVAAVMLTGSVEQAAAQAAPEADACGAATNGVVSCGAGTYADGIAYTGNLESGGYDGGPQDNVHTLTLGDPASRDSRITVAGWGVTVDYGGDHDVSVRMDSGNINATDDREYQNGDVSKIVYHNHGVLAKTSGTGNVNAQMNGGNIMARVAGSAGIAARIENGSSDKTATATMTGGTITVAQGNSEGVSAFTDGVGNVTAEMSGNSKIVTQHGDDQGGPAGAVAAYTHNRAHTGNVVARLIDNSEHRNQTIITAAGTGVRAVTRGAGGTATASMAGGIINIDGGDAYGVEASVVGTALDTSTADVEAFMTGGRITTNGTRAVGVRARTGKFGDAFVQMDETHHVSRITTHGWQAHGLQAFSDGTHDDSEGTATAVMEAGTIHVNGDAAHGAYAQANGGKGTALVQMNSGSIRTTGWGSYGLYARIDKEENAQEVKVEMTGGSIATYNTPDDSRGSHGIYADTSGSGNVVVEMVGGTVTTFGRNSHGIWAESEAPILITPVQGDNVRTLKPGGQSKAKAFVTLGADAVVTASGAGSDGIRVSGNYERRTVNSDEFVQLGANGFDINVEGTVTGGAGNGAAVRTISSAPGAITITDTGKVIAGDSGIAIHTETARSSGDGTPDDAGAAVITSAGTIEGDIRLGAGNDILNLTGGSFTGNLYAGDGNDTVTISAATEYNGSYILDGGAGDNDQLILQGQQGEKSITTTADRLLNWEHLTLNDTELSLDGVARLDMALEIDAGSAFHATGGNGAPTAGQVASVSGGGMTIAGDVTNAGDMTLSVQDGAVGDVITIDGDYTGSGTSTFALDARMDGTDTDTLHFMGDVTGDMELSIAGLGGGGVGGAPLAIDVVTVDGASDGATFTLMEGNHVMSDGEHAMISGAYLYRLAETDSGWALSALSEDDEITWQPASPLYDSYGAALLAFTAPASLRNRGSSQDFRSLAWDGGAGADTAGQDAGSPLWVQMGTDQITSSEENSTTGAALESSLWEMEIGADIVLNDSAAGLLVGGLMLSYATGSTDVTSDFGDGSIDTTGLGLGLSATWYDTRGFYVDGQVRLASYASDLSSDSFGTLTEGNSGTGLALSIEAGQRLDLGSRLTVIPQAQLSLSSVAFSDFTSEPREGPQGEAQQEQVALSEATSQRLRLGLEVGEQDPGASGLYGMLNLFHEFGAGSEVEVDGASLTTEHEPWAVGVGLGGTYAWNDRVDLFGDVAYATGLSNAGETSTLSASAGLKVTF